MITRIPTNPPEDGAPWTQRTVLDGVAYRLQLRWNSRAELWTLRIRDDAGALLAGPLPLLAGWSPNVGLTVLEGLPPGMLLFAVRSESGREVGLGELAARGLLVYQEAT